MQSFTSQSFLKRNYLRAFLSAGLISSCTAVSAQWNTNTTINTPVAVASYDQQDARIVSDTKGGAIISWVDFRNDPLNGDIYAQRLDGNGMPKWLINGVAACTFAGNQAAVAAVESGDGGIIMTWQDWRSGDRDVYAQKVDSSGNVLWTANGAIVCVKTAHQSNPKVVSDGAGGAIIVWEDSAAGSWDLYAQRLNSAGTALWTAGGVVVCNSANSQINPKVKEDGAGGAYITWQDKRNNLEYHIYAQRIDPSGNSMWTANGIAVCTQPGGQFNPKMELDGGNGVYIAWQDKRTGVYDIYAQKVSSTGIVLWATNGITVCNASGAQSAIDMTTDNVSGAIISWKDGRSAVYTIYAQMLNSSGSAMWSTNGVAVAPGINPNIIGDGSGGAILTWQDSTTAGGTWDVFSHRLNSGGTKVWGASPVPVATAISGQSSPKNVQTGAGGSIYCWQDKRTGNLDIYAHKLAANGTVSSVAESAAFDSRLIPYPNPFSSSTTITLPGLDAPDSWTLKVYDISGKLVLSKTIEGTRQVEIGKNSLQNGVYFFQAITAQKLLGSGNFVITE